MAEQERRDATGTGCRCDERGSKPVTDPAAVLGSARQSWPSVLAALAVHHTRRYLAGGRPETELERLAFATFERRRVSKAHLRERLEALDALPEDHPVRDRLHSCHAEESAFGIDQIRELVREELVQTAQVLAPLSPLCGTSFSEVPGKMRFTTDADDVNPLTFRIHRLNGLRTANHPGLSLSEYRPEELQLDCAAVVQGDESAVICEPRTTPCEGNIIDGYCAAVPTLRPGDVVQFEGVNFASVDMQLRLRSGPVERVVDLVVCGDVETPVVEEVDGVQRLIVDDRVRDHAGCFLPDDLSAGLYELELLLPPGIPEGFNGYTSRLEFIRILPPVSARYQVSSKTLRAIEETRPEWPASDEIELRAMVGTFDRGATTGSWSMVDYPRFGDMDSGETRDATRLLTEVSNFGVVAFVFAAFDVDDERLFEEGITDLFDAYAEIITSTVGLVVAELAALGEAIAITLGASAGWATVIAAAVSLGVTFAYAWWGRADIVIEDSYALSESDIAALVSPLFPAPAMQVTHQPSGLKRIVSTVQKGIGYVESRECQNHEFLIDSRYELVLAYHRIV